MIDWKNVRVCVTGGAGFLGSFVIERLRAAGVADERIFVPRRARYDLTREADVVRLYDDARPDVVLHLAAEVGGIGANRDNPGRFFFANMAMGLHLIEHARQRGLRKFVQVGTICAYPKFTPVPFHEDALWDGYPEETNAPYGVAKKALLVMCQSYRAQYGMNAIYLLPVNLYGPRDNFDLSSSHVIPAMIRKFWDAREAGAADVELWGDGSPSREFLYVEDAAEGIVTAAERYDDPDPVNLGNGREVRIAELATLIAGMVGYQGRIVWNAEKPNGQPRRALDVSRAKERFGFVARTSFEDGLRRTIAWYAEHRAEIRAGRKSGL
ncbi:MAG: GDP-L-fucose synthase [Planctomycetia bacterium]|nr:MAG: GDP-L-fucose synthase [Planctomycetia bacterium]